jgi:hypothetical protein
MLEVVHGRVPESLSGAIDEGPIHQAAPGRALLAIPGVARVLVEGGKRAVVDADPSAHEADVEWLLAGPVRSVAWLQRGTLALRAAALVIGGRAVALTGGPASGKSAVAAALALRDHAVLADSALPVERTESGPVAAASSCALELWPEAATALGLDPASGAVVRPALSKRAYPFRAGRSSPLAAVVVLERRTRQGSPAAERRRGAAAAQLVGRFTAMAPVLDGMGLRPAHLRWATWLASEVPVYHLRWDRHRSDLQGVADIVETLLP